ncbi:zinc metalloproteinase nas-4-like [Hydractinia symbiolongicarpus]|uniref:zinc metalloproteinase nas-4-like n=1 Tax=Hydractinia symbiolongicarpus TaxID=13093 RepID=UPI00254EDD1E|nr:zinc metalloproteinase nas-4-like [Hydractinia symbiolongicarpus]
MATLWWSILSFAFFTAVAGEWVKQMENDGLYEGDMVLTPAQLIDAKNVNLRYASTKANHWPTTIYYDWDYELANKKGIVDAIAEYEKYTCLRFKRGYSGDMMYFTIGNGGCSSGVGYERGRGRHYVSLGEGCWGKGVVIHEMAHRLGIYHEQSRPDRDDYITVQWENIGESRKFNFKKQKASIIDSFGTKYDYKSIMHYGAYTFSKNKKPVMITKDPSMQKVIGQRIKLSEIDKEQINKMYNCHIEPAHRPYVFQHDGEGNCFTFRQDVLYLNSGCKQKFILAKNGELQLAGTSKCAYADATNSNVIKFKESCGQTFQKTYISGDYFALKNVQTGKCVQPSSFSGKKYSKLVLKPTCIFGKYRMI